MGYQLKITIKDSHPPIWRRILVPSHITFYDLDDIIEAAFGWQHEHMFAFNFGNRWMEFIGAPIPEDDDNAEECIDGWLEEGDSFRYTYDFGDDWVHTIKVEKEVPYEKRYPQVIKFKGPNMIEDCGGIWGFYEQIDEAEPFDMEAVNERFSTWNFPETYSVHDDLLGEDEEVLWELQKQMEEREDGLRQLLPPPKTLDEIYMHYTKDNLKQIARMYGYKGYHKLSKKELAVQLAEYLLDTSFLEKQLLNTSEDEFRFFKCAIEEQGISMTEELLQNYLLLITYGGFHPAYDFYQVSLDVQEKFKEICTPEFCQECTKRQKFTTYCDGALYLYGVLPVEKLVEIYHLYEKDDMDVKEAEGRIERMIQRGEPYALKEGFLMDEELAERDLFQCVLKKQEGCSYYIPEEKEEFLTYGEYECQEPDENTEFFVRYLQKKLRRNGPEALMLFYEIQDGLRMNLSVEELAGILLDRNCTISSPQQMQEVVEQILKFGNYTRKWDYRGHTNAEVQREKAETFAERNKNKVIGFPGAKKVYPNDPCPCGSGKKFKHCCKKG